MDTPRTFSFRRHLLVAAVLLALVPGAALGQSAPLIRLNSGGPSFTLDGTNYTSDAYFTDSKTASFDSREIAGTEEDDLFRTERITNDDGLPFGYSIPVPQNGIYSVRLHFAETAFTVAGRRIFDVAVEGTTVLDDYDIFASAGGANTAITETILNIAVNDDTLNVVFSAVVERAKINAIEVFGDFDPISIPFGINVAGPALTVSDVPFVEDPGYYFLEGQISTDNLPIANTTADLLYQSERFANTLRFVLPGVPQGVYSLELHFSESFFDTAGQRLMDIVVEGDTLITDFDIVGTAGALNTAVIQELEGVSIIDGILNITFVRSNSGTATAKVAGIALTSASLVAVEDETSTEVPGTHRLTAAYPNPFNPETQFTLTVARSQHVTVRVFDMLGREVDRLFDGVMPANQIQSMQFAPHALPSGIYLIQAAGESFSEAQRVVLLK
ncbi:MAG: malectin domain-containing carbohydrate-binding protein [Rhodothermales bacterium]